MSGARIAPLERPFPPAFDAQMQALMRGAEPLRLFTTLAKSERAWTKFSAGSLLDRDSPLSLRQREIVIHRTTARCGCEYEWGVHAAIFAPAVAVDAAQLHATVHGPADAATWSPEERVLLATVDALLDERRLGDDAWAGLKAHFSDEQAFEIVQLVAFYHGVALICGAFDLPLETQAARFPAA
ncbi:carboxymuconolactone decarboxylase family protein [Sphingomonas sp. CBMAI 2297]|uniref:carboxymuconolactone decarboxylase family protein n=1 Tax=Sphingomonas sp. CBMAI 2297 TaxID=2991720 RepID=UPI002456CABD|nr:carboxymuconolactone decarboxylase family protein [Sphingomonas sp. CBMAI 2297]MDH4743747.1 carboxymuconolactone decarboxylase family protein [Sphingomonas sp. CBMAI 2297]